MKPLILILTLLLLLSSLPSCAPRREAWEVLEERMAEYTLPDGVCYRSDAAEGESTYASPALLASLYGTDAAKRITEFTESYAIYLSSFALPCEMAVFRAYSRSDTHVLMAVCLERLDQLRVLLRHTEHATALKGASIVTDGYFVIMQIPPMTHEKGAFI